MFANGGYKQRILVLLLSLGVVAALFVMMSGAARAQKEPQTEKKVKMDKRSADPDRFRPSGRVQ
jgi:flagellar basal body-associated protein FliL